MVTKQCRKKRFLRSKEPFVYPIIINENINIGYVQACPLGEKFEIGYHIAENYTGNGFATEAVKIFLPVIMDMFQIYKIYGIVLEENFHKSVHVLDMDALE